MTATVTPTNTETFLALARDAILTHADIKPETVDKLHSVKLTYGAGMPGVRGVTYFNAWQARQANDEPGVTDFIEIGAMTQDSWVQLAGTLLHELAHSAAGLDAGHSVEWKDTAVRMGFVKRPEAAGQRYWLSLFRPELRLALYRIAQHLNDGTPLFGQGHGVPAGQGTIRPCRAGIGTRGGKSRGTGSGSRLRLWECQCDKPVKVRVASDDFQAHCDVCRQAFERK